MMQFFSGIIQGVKYRNKDIQSLILLFLLPLGLFLINRNLFFMNSIDGAIDPWGYLGYFTDLSTHVSNLDGGYAASRLGWTLLGSLFYKVLPPILANIALRLLLYYVCLFSLFFLIRDLFQKRGLALTVSVYFCTQLPIWFCLGRDYTDGGCIFYTLISMFSIYYSYKFITRKLIFLIAAGISFAFLIATHFFALILILPILLWLVFLRIQFFPHQNYLLIINDTILFLLGIGVGLLGLCLISFDLGGHFLFLSSSIAFAKGFGNYGNHPWTHICQYEIYDYWIPSLIPSAAISLLSLLTNLWPFQKVKQEWKQLITSHFLRMNYLLILTLFLVYEQQGGCILRTYFSMLVPFAILAIAEFINSCDRYLSRNTYSLMVILSLAQALAGLFYVRFITGKQLDKTGIEDSFNNFFIVARIAIISLLFLALFLYLLAFFGQSRFCRRNSLILFFVALILAPWPGYNYDGLISHNAYSNIQQYRSVYEVINYLALNNSLHNSIYWYDAQSPIGNHYRSIFSTTFTSRNLINEYYPYLDKLHNTVNVQKNNLKLISERDYLEAYTETYNMKVVDANGALSPQVEITPGKRLVIFSDFNADLFQTPEDALYKQGIQFNVIKRQLFQVGTFKFNVTIGEVPIVKESPNVIFSCTIDRKYDPLNVNYPYTFEPDAKNCIQSSAFDKVLKYDVLVTQQIPISPNSKYLISLMPIPKPTDSRIDLSPSDADSIFLNPNLSHLWLDLTNPDLALFDMTYCPKKPISSPKQFVFDAESAKNVVISLTAPLACGIDFPHLNRLEQSLSLKIFKLSSLPPQVEIEPVYLSQNIPRDWWRARLKKVIIVPKKVEYNEFHQAFEILTNKAPGEDFQIASPLIHLQKDIHYIVHFNYKIIEGGFNIFALADDNKTKLANMTFCKTADSSTLEPQTFEFHSATSKTSRIVLSREPKCFQQSEGQSHFFIEGVRLWRKDRA